jgi:hypothetical protein
MKITYLQQAHQVGDILSLEEIKSLPEGTHFTLRYNRDKWDDRFTYWREGSSIKYYNNKDFIANKGGTIEHITYTSHKWFNVCAKDQEFMLI